MKSNTNKSFYSKRLISIILIILSAIVFFLRFYAIPQNLFFGPEQGIDFLVMKKIVIDHKLTLIGAKSDVEGVFHGPIYYYIGAIPFAISHGDPVVVLGFMILLKSAAASIYYLLGKELFSKKVGIISAIIFAFSFEAIVYARWLSSHPLALPLSALFIYCLVKFLKGSKKYLIFASITFALLGQTEFLNYIFFGAIIILLMIFYRKNFFKYDKKILLLNLFIVVFLSTFNYALFDIKHDFLVTNSLIKLISNNTGYHIDIASSLYRSIGGFINAFINFIAPIPFVGFIILLLSLYFLIKNRLQHHYNILLLIWLLTPMAILVMLRHDVLSQFFVAIGPAAFVSTAYICAMLFEKNKFLGALSVIIIVVSNLYYWLLYIPSNTNIFFQAPQLYLRFSDQKKVIDEIYKRAEGKPFSFQAYTIPYWSQQGWEYLFWQYGGKKYHYEPISVNAKKLFVIVQKDYNNKAFQENWLKNTVAKWGTKRDEFVYGILKVEELAVK